MQFNADEVFAMAERVEENAVEFYTKAADLHAARHDVDFLRRLARMEADHRKRFAAMRAALPESRRQPPEGYPYLKATLYLNRLADAHAGEGTLSAAVPLDASDALDDLLLRGVRMETGAIAFYVGLKDLVPANRGRGEIDRIIEEEKAHVAVLAEELARLRTAR